MHLDDKDTVNTPIRDCVSFIYWYKHNAEISYKNIDCIYSSDYRFEKNAYEFTKYDDFDCKEFN